MAGENNVVCSWGELYDFLKDEYDLIDMSLTMTYGENCTAEMEIFQSGLIRLVGDLRKLKELNKEK